MSAVRGGERVLAGRVRLGAGLAISLALAGALVRDRVRRQRRAAAGQRDAGRDRGDRGGRPGGRGGSAVRRRRAAARRGRARGAGRARRSDGACRSCGRCTRPTRGSRPTARLPTWAPSRPGSRRCGSRPPAGRPCCTGCCWRSTVVSLYGLATKVAPGWLAEDEIYARLREPYGYWNAVGITAAMGIPLCLWLGTRPGPVLPAALAPPLLGLLIVTMLLSFSQGQHPGRARRRGDLARARAAAAEDAGRAAAGRCRRRARDRLGLRPQRAHGRSRRARAARGCRRRVRPRRCSA